MAQRKRITRFGIRPHAVSVFSEATASGRYCRAQWRVKGKIAVRSWPDTPEGRREAKAFAETLATELRSPAKAPPITLTELWARYVDAEFEALRPKTRVNYRLHWRAWSLFAHEDTRAEAVSRETLDEFRKALKGRGIAISQIRKHVELIKRVYRFGVDRELLPPVRLLDYQVKAAKDEKTQATAEYRGEDARKIIAALSSTKSTEWRAWLFTTIAHFTGARTNAILHLTWDDVDFESALVTWRARWDKVGKERRQPVPNQVVHALRQAEVWRAVDGYSGPWVFYTARQQWKGDRPMTYGGVQWMLRQAERRAGISHVHMNAMHRFRRGIVGDVIEATGGNVRLAMAYIGDDVRQATKYVKDRDEQLQEVADLLSGTRTPDAGADSPANATDPLPTPEGDG